MNRHDDEHDELWELLGKARTAKPSPFFARNVLRAIRQAEPVREVGFLEWLRSGWNWLAMSGAAVAVLFVTFGMQSVDPRTDGLIAASPESVVIEEVVASPDFAVIANLDLLVAMDDNDLWLQDAP